MQRCRRGNAVFSSTGHVTQTGHIDLLCAIDLSCAERRVSNSVHHGSNVLRLVPSLSAATADAGDAAEDPGSDAHSEGRILTQDSIHTRVTVKNSNTDALHHYQLNLPHVRFPPNHNSTSSAAHHTWIRDPQGSGETF